MKIVLLIVGLVIGAAAGWFTAPAPAEVNVGPVSVEVEGGDSGGTMMATAPEGGGVEVTVGNPSMLDDRNTRTLIFAAIGGILGLVIGFIADRRRPA